MRLAVLFLLASTLMSQSLSPIRTVGKGPMSGVPGSREVVVRSAADWAALWRVHAPSAPLPAVDFSKEMVVGVFLGSRPTAGFAVEVVRTTPAGDGLTVEYVETRPSKNALTAEIITGPYHLVAVPARTGEVRFERIEK